MTQELIVTGLFLTALLYLGQRAWRRWKTGQGGSCPGCNGCGKPQPTPLITLEIRRK